MNWFFAERMLRRWEQRDERCLAGKLLPSGVTVLSDVPFAGEQDPALLLDIYIPERASGRLPAVVDFHGGGFMCGSKAMDRLFCAELASRGYIVFCVGYRLARGGCTFLQQAQDAVRAAEWVAKNAEGMGADMEDVLYCGHSSGAVLAVLCALFGSSLALRAAYSIPEDVSLPRCKGLLLDGGLLSVTQKSLPYWGMRSMCFAKGYQKQPYYLALDWAKLPALRGLPPVCLLTNHADELRPMSHAFASCLQASGVQHLLLDNGEGEGGHMAVVFDPRRADCAHTLDTALGWLKSGVTK